MQEKKDRELIILLGKSTGEGAAYCQIFKLYYPTLLKFANAMLKDEASAKDVVQNAFVKLWMRRSTLSPDTNLKAWLYTVVKNEILDILRSLRVKKRNILGHEELNIPSQDSDRISFIETSSLLSKAIQSMPTQRRTVFEMSLQNIPNAEIADKLGLSIRTVEKHLELARKYMKNFSC